MSEKHWYQSGWALFGISIALIVFARFCYLFLITAEYEARPQVTPEIVGHMEKPFFGSPTLIITVWHQHAGNIRNGALLVTMTGPMAPSEDKQHHKVHSFEFWEPNRSHAVKLSFPLRNYDPNQEIPLEFWLYGKNIKADIIHLTWVNEKWKSASR